MIGNMTVRSNRAKNQFTCKYKLDVTKKVGPIDKSPMGEIIE